MSLYRCAVCGSPNLARMTEKDGFSYGKAAAGVITFGAIGAVAGLDGKKTDVYKCPDCGHTMSEPMDLQTKSIIDACVSDETVRHQFGWEMLKSKYKNIESGRADQRVAKAASELDSAVQTVIDEVNREYDKCLEMSEEELDADEKRVAAIRARYDDEIKKQAQANIEKARREFDSNQNEKLSERTETLERAKKEVEQIKAELARPSQAEKKHKTYKWMTPLVFVLMMAVLIILSNYQIIADKTTNTNVIAAVTMVGFIATIVCLVKMIKYKIKAGKDRKVREEKAKSLPGREKQLEEIAQQVDNIKNKPETVYGLKIPSEEEEIRRLRDGNRDYPLIVPARLRIKDHSKLSRAEQKDVDGTILKDIALRVFRTYGGEIRRKKLNEIMYHTVPESLHEDRFRLLAHQSMSSFLGNSFKSTYLNRRTEESTIPGSEFDDLGPGGRHYLIYFSLK